MSVQINGTNGLVFADGSTQKTAANGSFKNRIINGAMMIDQRNAGASLTIPSAANTYSLDRWTCQSSQASKFSVQQNAGSVTPPTGFTNYLGCTVLSAATVGSTDYFTVGQKIEGLNVADFGWGTADAQPVTLSFRVRSSLTGTFGGAINNAAGVRAYPFTYTISSANTWTTISVTIPGDTTGTWVTNNGNGLTIFFSLGMGSTYAGASGSWSSGGYNGATGCVNVVSTNGATFYITGVQLEKGSTATSFDYRPYGTELQLCQRYYQTYGNISGTTAFMGGMNGSTQVRASGILPVVMRSSPSVALTGTPTFYSYGYANPTYSSVSSLTATTQSYIFAIAVTGTTGVGNVCDIILGSSTMTFNAEL